jgi:Tfp pilus assembly protein PilV
MLAVFTLLLFTVSSLSLQTTITMASAQTSSSLAQDIVDLAQQEGTDQLSSSSSADDNTQTDTNTQSFDVDQDQDIEADVENEAEQATGNIVVLQEQEEEEDTTPPTLTVPEDITVEATSADGAVVTFTVTAEDDVDGTATLDENNRLIQDNVGGDIDISCDPPSGSEFAIGETVVQCTATDEAGNTATASFTVIINPVPDTMPPVITVPSNMVVAPTSTEGAVVTFTVTAEDDIDGTATLDEENTLTQDGDVGGDITISCDPPSGSEFAIGETEVECTATDEAGNTATASFTVIVNPDP